jgi:DNA-directed RNA polymerase subunit K/omega
VGDVLHERYALDVRIRPRARQISEQRVDGR